MICVRIYVHIEIDCIIESLFPILQYILWSADSWPITTLWKVYIIPLNVENITQHHTTQNYLDRCSCSRWYESPPFSKSSTMQQLQFHWTDIVDIEQYNQYKDLDDMPQNYGPQNLVMPNARFWISPNITVLISVGMNLPFLSRSLQ